MEWTEKIKSLCIARGTTIKALEKELEFSNGSLTKNGIPNANRLYKIAKYFDVPMEYFFDDDAYKELARESEKLISNLSKLSKSKQLHRVSAGSGAYNDTYSSETIEDIDGDFELAEVVGDSMYPILQDKDIVVIKHQTETTPYDLSLVKVDGEHATIKYVEIVENGLWLRAENKEVFEDRFYSIQEIINLPISVQGKVVELRRKI